MVQGHAFEEIRQIPQIVSGTTPAAEDAGQEGRVGGPRSIMEPESGGNLQNRTTVVVGLFLGLHVLWAGWRPLPLWGVSLLAYVSLPAGLLFAVLCVCLLLPATGELIVDAVSRAGRGLSPWQDGRRRHLGHAAVVAVGLLAFTTFRTATPLLGDGQMLLLELDDLWGVQRVDRAPLAYRNGFPFRI